MLLWAASVIVRVCIASTLCCCVILRGRISDCIVSFMFLAKSAPASSCGSCVAASVVVSSSLSYAAFSCVDYAHWQM